MVRSVSVLVAAVAMALFAATSSVEASPAVEGWKALFAATAGGKWTKCSTDKKTPCKCSINTKIKVTCTNNIPTAVSLINNNLASSSFTGDSIEQMISGGVTSINLSSNSKLKTASGACLSVPSCSNPGVTCTFPPTVVVCTTPPSGSPTPQVTASPTPVPPTLQPTTPQPTNPGDTPSPSPPPTDAPTTPQPTSPTFAPTMAPSINGTYGSTAPTVTPATNGTSMPTPSPSFFINSTAPTASPSFNYTSSSPTPPTKSPHSGAVQMVSSFGVAAAAIVSSLVVLSA